MAAVLLLAAGLRLPQLGSVPPGLSHDDAANAWNAYCLFKTGQDQYGQRWPILYFRALGENRSTLFLYALWPFEALGGLSVYTSRLPAAVAGVFTVWLICWVARRLFGTGTGLAAAALMAINPTHIQLSRMGHEASLAPLLALIPLAALLWARLPPLPSSAASARGSSNHGASDPNQTGAARPPSPVRALVAGLIAGICCYGYPAARILIPPLLGCTVLLTWGAWRSLLRSRRGLASALALLLGLAATIGPVGYAHATNAGQINKRAQTTWIWQPGDSLTTTASKILDRYAGHFGPRFLFSRGDEDEVVWTAGVGFLPWYALPMLVVGLISALAALRGGPAHVLLAAVVLYPIGDCFNWHESLHGLRSSAGLVWLILLAGLGAARAVAFLRMVRPGAGGEQVPRRMRASLLALIVIGAALVIPESASFLRTYFVTRQRQTAVYDGNDADLLEACKWLRPRADDFDAVICTAYDVGQPYLLVLVGLGYSPQRWFAEPRDIELAVWDRCKRFGKFHFVFDDERERLIAQLRSDGRPQRVTLWLRPTEPFPAEPVRRILRPDGTPALLIYDVTL